MSKKEYDLYLETHKENVAKGYRWMKDYLPQLIKGDYDEQIKYHDISKYDPEEYDAYNKYFYSKNKTEIDKNNFKYAWNRHIHHNKHHWQHWIIINDDVADPITVLRMPYNYIIEMICDWWSFSWASGNLYEIFGFYEARKDHILLNEISKAEVNYILALLHEKITMDPISKFYI